MQQLRKAIQPSRIDVGHWRVKALVLAIASIQTQGSWRGWYKDKYKSPLCLFVLKKIKRCNLKWEHSIFFSHCGACAPLGGTPVSSPFASHFAYWETRLRDVQWPKWAQTTRDRLTQHSVPGTWKSSRELLSTRPQLSQAPAVEGTKPNIYSESGLAMTQTHKCLIVLAAPAGIRKASGTAHLCHSQRRGLTVRAGSGPQGATCTPGWTHIEQASCGLGAPTCSPWDAVHELGLREQKPGLLGQGKGDGVDPLLKLKRGGCLGPQGQC